MRYKVRKSWLGWICFGVATLIIWLLRPELKQLRWSNEALLKRQVEYLEAMNAKEATIGKLQSQLRAYEEDRYQKSLKKSKKRQP